MAMDFLRQLDIVTPEQLDFSINIIGCGGIGSPAALALSKMGCQLTLYDPDIIEEHNLPNQIFPVGSVGRPKVEVLAEVIREFTGVVPTAVQRAVTDEEPLQGVCIVGVDTMAARKAIWRGIRGNEAVPLLVDGRMGGEIGLIYTIRPTALEEVKFYEQTLHSDEEAFQVPCTAQSIIYNVFMMACLIAVQVKKFALGERLSKEIKFDLKNLILLAEELTPRPGLSSAKEG